MIALAKLSKVPLGRVSGIILRAASPRRLGAPRGADDVQGFPLSRPAPVEKHLPEMLPEPEFHLAALQTSLTRIR